jgi:glycosyltransferase involved in cell wall biosynthesis
MTRVLHVISGIAPEQGGPTTALLGMTKAQVRAGLDVSLVATWVSPTGSDPTSFVANGVKTTLIGPARPRLSRHPDIRPTLTRLFGQTDVVHVHAVWEQVQHDACDLARRAGVPYVVTPHGMLSRWNMAQRPWRKRLYVAMRLRRDLNGAAGIHFTTEAERASVAALGLTAPTFVETLGVDLSEFTDLPQHGAFRARFPQTAGKRIVLFLGRVDYKKGLDLLVPAFARAGLADAILVIAGPDNCGYSETVRAIAAREGVTDRVLFTGMLSGRERVEALVDAEMFALTSYVENFGVAVVESLAAGTPVLVSTEVNIADDVSRLGVGRVVPNDVPQITHAIQEMMAGDGPDGELSRLAARCRPVVAEHFDWNAIARHWVAHYDAIAGRRLVEG